MGMAGRRRPKAELPATKQDTRFTMGVGQVCVSRGLGTRLKARGAGGTILHARMGHEWARCSLPGVAGLQDCGSSDSSSDSSSGSSSGSSLLLGIGAGKGSARWRSLRALLAIEQALRVLVTDGRAL